MKPLKTTLDPFLYAIANNPRDRLALTDWGRAALKQYERNRANHTNRAQLAPTRQQSK